MAERCGSFPFMNIAADTGLPYWVVVCYADQRRRIITAGNAIVRQTYWEQRAVRAVVGRFGPGRRVVQFAIDIDRALGLDLYVKARA